MKWHVVLSCVAAGIDVPGCARMKWHVLFCIAAGIGVPGCA